MAVYITFTIFFLCKNSVKTKYLVLHSMLDRVSQKNKKHYRKSWFYEILRKIVIVKHFGFFHAVIIFLWPEAIFCSQNPGKCKILLIITALNSNFNFQNVLTRIHLEKIPIVNADPACLSSSSPKRFLCGKITQIMKIILVSEKSFA